MFTEAVIIAIDRLSNNCKIRIPLFETVNSGNKVILNARIAIIPGIYNSYDIDDIVYITFENNRVDMPIVISKVYTTNVEEEKNNCGTVNCAALNVLNVAALPADTVINFDNTIKDKNLYANYNTLDKIVGELSSLRNEVNTLKAEVARLKNLIN